MSDGISSFEEKMYQFYVENQDFANDCRDYEEEDPPGEMMYDAFCEFIKIMDIVEDHFTYCPKTS
jgi:hypothetical protein